MTGDLRRRTGSGSPASTLRLASWYVRPGDEAAPAPIRFLPDVKRGLNACAVTWIEIDHAEADDLIAALVTGSGRRRILIMSRDMDYYQLITGSVTILNKMRSGHRHIDPAAVYARHQVTPTQCRTSRHRWLDSGGGRTVQDQYSLALKYRDMIHLNPGIALPATPAGHASPQLPRPADIVETLGLW